MQLLAGTPGAGCAILLTAMGLEVSIVSTAQRNVPEPMPPPLGHNWMPLLLANDVKSSANVVQSGTSSSFTNGALILESCSRCETSRFKVPHFFTSRELPISARHRSVQASVADAVSDKLQHALSHSFPLAIRRERHQVTTVPSGWTEFQVRSGCRRGILP